MCTHHGKGMQMNFVFTDGKSTDLAAGWGEKFYKIWWPLSFVKEVQVYHTGHCIAGFRFFNPGKVQL
jgi:hypothetical protein